MTAEGKPRLEELKARRSLSVADKRGEAERADKARSAVPTSRRRRRAVNILVYVVIARYWAEASWRSGSVAEGFSSLAAGLQARGGDARRCADRYRVVCGGAYRQGERRRRKAGIRMVLAFRGVLGGGVRSAVERDRRLQEHPEIHGHISGCAGVERHGHSGWRPLPGCVLRGALRVWGDGGERRSAVGAAGWFGAGLRAARGRQALSSCVLRAIFAGG